MLFIACLLYDRSIAPSKTGSPQHAIYCMSVVRQVHSLFQSGFSTACYLLFPLSISSIFAFPWGYWIAAYVFFSSSRHFYPPSIFLEISCFRRQFLRKMSPIQLAFLLFTVTMTFHSFLTLFEPSSIVTWSVKLIFSTTFRKFSGISDLLSELSNFQHHKKLYSKSSNLLISSSNLSPICWRKESSPCWNMISHDHPGYNFLYTSSIICYQTT